MHNKLYMAGGGFSGLTGFLFEIPPDHIQVIVRLSKNPPPIVKNKSGKESIIREGIVILKHEIYSRTRSQANPFISHFTGSGNR